MKAASVIRKLAKAPLGSDGERVLVAVLVELAKAVEALEQRVDHIAETTVMTDAMPRKRR